MAEILDRVGILAELGVDYATGVVSGGVTRIAWMTSVSERDIAGVGGLSCRRRRATSATWVVD